MRLTAGILVLLAAAAQAERLDTAATIVLENDVLKVELYADRPAPLCYLHKPTGIRMCGAGPDGVWRINGQDMPWARWRIKPFRRSDWTAAAYEMALTGTNLRLQARFILRDSLLEMRIENVHDPDSMLQSLEWVEMPLLQCRNPEFTYWREIWRKAQRTGSPKTAWHTRPACGRIGRGVPDTDWQPAIRSCVYKQDALCVFVASDCPSSPLMDKLCGADVGYAVALNAYYHSRGAEPLRARVVFLHDYNGDGEANLHDYALWINHHTHPRQTTASVSPSSPAPQQKSAAKSGD